MVEGVHEVGEVKRRLEEFNRKVLEVRQKIREDFGNVIEAVEQYTSGHAHLNEHTLRQYCRLIGGTEIELIVAADNGYYPPWDWIRATLKINQEMVASFIAEDEEVEFVEEDDILTLWDEEKESEDWVTVSFTRDTINHGSYTAIFVPGREKFIDEIYSKAIDEYPGEDDYIITLPIEEGIQYIEEGKKYKVPGWVDEDEDEEVVKKVVKFNISNFQLE